MDLSLVRKVESSFVTQLLIKKGIVSDEFNAQILYKMDKEFANNQDHKAKIKELTYEDFMAIFSKRMFRDALLRVTDRINKVSSEKHKQETGEEDAKSLILKIYEF